MDLYWPVRNWVAGQEVSDRWASKASSVFTSSPHHSHYCLSSAPWRIQHYGELYNYFNIYHNVIIIETKCTISLTHLNRLETIPLSPPVHGKIVFHKTGSCCQKFWAPLHPPESSSHVILALWHRCSNFSKFHHWKRIRAHGAISSQIRSKL